MRNTRNAKVLNNFFVSLAIFAISILGIENSFAAKIGSGKPCSDKDFLKTVQSGDKYFLCAEGPKGLQWNTTESPATTKKRNDALSQKNNSKAAWSQQASRAWAGVVQSANYVLQRAKAYDSGSTGYFVPGDLRQSVYNVGVSASNASRLYSIEPNESAASWARQAISLANNLQRLKQNYQAQGIETLMPEISSLLSKVGSARGYAVSK